MNQAFMVQLLQRSTTEDEQQHKRIVWAKKHKDWKTLIFYKKKVTHNKKTALGQIDPIGGSSVKVRMDGRFS